MLKKLLSMTRAQRAEVVQSIDAKLVNEPWAAKRLAKMKGKQGGFTLLELLVVVAIIAAIAGTSTILLRDTDRQAAAAAHVGMMDELMKGIATFQVLNGGKLPNNFDSLTSSAAGALAATADKSVLLNDGLAGSLVSSVLTDKEIGLLDQFGVKAVRVINEGQTLVYTNDLGVQVAGAYDCSDAKIKDLIKDKGSNVTASTIYRSNVANGCGVSATIGTGNALLTWEETAGNWERVNALFTKSVVGGATADTSEKLIALGAGPDLELFQGDKRGAMTTTPVYRHVDNDEYNRFVVLLNVDTARSEVRLQAIIDGAGDTKDEELGEWDGTRPSI